METKFKFVWLALIPAFLCAWGTTMVRAQTQASPAGREITRVRLDRAGQKTIVRVVGNGMLTYHIMRLNSPERVVVDFPGTHLALLHSRMPSGAPPVLGIRAGQFKPDMARVVLDLNQAVPFRVLAEENGITVEFEAVSPAPVQNPPAPATAVAQDRNEIRRREKEAGMAARHSSTNTPPTMRPSPSAPVSAAPTNNVPAASSAGPLLPAFEDGMVTFAANHQPMRTELMQIGAQAGITVNVGEGLGDEQISVEFRHYRVDEALRQILKGYDAFFFYAAGEEVEQPATLKAVWVFPAGHGREFLRPSPGVAMAAVKAAEPEQDDPGASFRSRALESLIRRKGHNSVAEVQQAIGDRSAEVRLRALTQGLISRVEIPQATLVELALKDESADVRLLALRALPEDASLNWVYERAAGDSSPAVNGMARDILQDLSVIGRAKAWATHQPDKPQQ